MWQNINYKLDDNFYLLIIILWEIKYFSIFFLSILLFILNNDRTQENTYEENVREYIPFGFFR